MNRVRFWLLWLILGCAEAYLCYGLTHPSPQAARVKFLRPTMINTTPTVSITFSNQVSPATNSLPVTAPVMR